MNVIGLLPVLLTGLLGSVHCIGMCGGIAGALSAAGAPPPVRPFPVAVVTLRAPAQAGAQRMLAYNTGRIAGYAVAGALAGGLAGAATALSQLQALQLLLYWGANAMLIALGLHLMGAWRGLAHIEALGLRAWRMLMPLLGKLLPVDSLPKALALGGLWGWVPCAMVYSMLLTAMLSGSAAAGAATMIAFGLGTLPAMLGLGLAFQPALRRPAVRRACGAMIFLFGVLGLLRAAYGMPLGWLEVLCLTAPP